MRGAAAPWPCYPARVSIYFRRSALTGLVLVALCLPGRVARADASSWLFVGAGPAWFDGPSSWNNPSNLRASMQLDAGLGSSPAAPVAVGGLVRMHTLFKEGSDLGLFLRIASGGYVRGNWGAALDLGGYERWWGPAPAPGYAGTVSLGAPWGITLNLDAARDIEGSNTFAAVLGLDLARFSVYRTTGLSWLPNPSGGR
jgi:hypothetical protein